MAPIQTLPPLASEYSLAQRRQIDEAIGEVGARWRRMGPRFDSSWAVIAAAVTSIIRDAQADIAVRATEFVPAILEETGQTRALIQYAEPEPAAFVGLTGAGTEIGAALSVSTIRAKQAVEQGASAAGALIKAGEWLALATNTILADTARGAESLGMYSRPVTGYVRMVNGGACGRCVVQAGKWFRTNRGFLRHPRCRCVHIPASESIGSDWTTNPREYFDSLNTEQRIKLMGSKANAQAVVDGADISQIVNAYSRGRSSLALAQPTSPLRRKYGLKFTEAGSTDRSWAYQQQVGMGLRQPVRSAGTRQRLMPESIYANAGSREEALEMLRANGWITDVQARAVGRKALDETRRIERANRRRDRREAARAAATPTPTTEFERLKEVAEAMKARRN